MAPREHDGWEGAGTRPWDDDPEQDVTEDVDDVSPADQWFGGGMLPPPPPYAQPAGGQPAPSFPQAPPDPPPMQPEAPAQPAGTNGNAPAYHDEPPQYDPAPPVFSEEQWAPPHNGEATFAQEQPPPPATFPPDTHQYPGTVQEPPEPGGQGDGRGTPAVPTSDPPERDIPEAEPLPPLDPTAQSTHEPTAYASNPQPTASEYPGYAPEAAPAEPEQASPYTSFSEPQPGPAWEPPQPTAAPAPDAGSDVTGGPQPGYSVELPAAEEPDWRQAGRDGGLETGSQGPHAPADPPAPDAAQGIPGIGGEPHPPGVSHAPEADPPPSSGLRSPYEPEAPQTPPAAPPSPAAGQPPMAPENPAAAQPASGGWQAPPPHPTPPYTTDPPHPSGGQGAWPASGQPSPPPGQNPYDWRPQGQPNAPQTGPQASPAPPNQAPQPPQGPPAQPQTPPATEDRPNPYQVPGQPPQAPPPAQAGYQAPPAPPGPTQQGPPQQGPPAQHPGGAPPGAFHGGVGFQYRTHLPQEEGPGQSRPETAEALDADSLVRGRRQSNKGWRRVVRSATFGMVDPGMSAAETRRRELTQRATTQVAGGHHRVAVLSLKGGVGKTTTTVALGSTLATLRGDRVLAVDANPDRGTLSDKVRLETAATIRDLLNERQQVTRYADVRGFTSQASSRLEILASDRDPAVSEAFSENDYREVTRLLEHFYSICITDCGTGLLHSAMRGVLGLADQVVLVSSASVDGARSASATLDWLDAHEYGYHVRGAVVVLSMVRQDGKSTVDIGRLEEHFASRCRSVVRVPWDPHLEEGAEVDLERLAPGTRDAYLQLAATVGEAFAWPR